MRKGKPEDDRRIRTPDATWREIASCSNLYGMTMGDVVKGAWDFAKHMIFDKDWSKYSSEPWKPPRMGRRTRKKESWLCR